MAGALHASIFLLSAGVAQATDTTATSAEEAADGSGSLQEVVVTAERRAQRLLDVTVSTAVLSGAPLEALGSAGQDIRQLSFSVPSLNIESSNGRTFPRLYIRGYGNTDFTPFASQPVGLYYDDIVQENPTLKGFPIFDQADVEVLRGPQGTLFGRNSPAGVVKLESNKPVLGEFSGYASLSDGTYNTANFEGVVNAPINDIMALRLSTQGQHRDNWVTAPYNPAGNRRLEGYDDWALRMQLLVKPSDAFNALINVHGRTLNGSSRLFRGNIISLGSNSLVPGFRPDTIYTDGYNGQSYSSLGANVHLTWTTPALTYQSITGYESVRHYFTQGDIDGGFGPGVVVNPNVPSGPGFFPVGGIETAIDMPHHYQLSQELRMISNQSGPLQGQAGIFLFYEDVASNNLNYDITGATIQNSTISEQKNDAEAAFASLEYAFTPMFKLRGGLRYTLDHKSFDVPFTDVPGGLPPPTHASASARKLTWEIGPSVKLSPDVNLYARVATGFRAPSFGAPASGPPPLPIQIARSEDNVSYELGIKSELPDYRSSLSFDVYYFDVSNQQLTAFPGFGNLIELINARNTFGKGAELSLETRPLSGLQLNLSGSYNYTRIDDPTLAVSPCFNFGPGFHCTILDPLDAGGNELVNGNPLPQAARWVGDFSARYAVPIRGNAELYVFTDMSYRSEMNSGLGREVEAVLQPLYQLGARLGYNWSNDKYEIAAFCRNCTNQVRAIGAGTFLNATGMINDPRIIGGEFRINF